MLRSAIVTLALTLTVSVSVVPQQQPPFTAGTNLVVVPVVVVDRKGQTVANLTASDFSIEEDGKPVAVELFAAPAQAAGDQAVEGRLVVLVLDNLRTPAELAFRVKGIANRFVDRMGPRDTMTVIPISKGQALTTTDKTALKAAIDRYQPDFGDTTRTMQQDSEHSLRTIGELSAQMAKAPQRRKVLAIIGNTATFNPQLQPAFDRDPALSREWADAARETSRYNVSVYAIDAFGLRDGSYAGDYATSFAAETGGWAWSNTNNFGGAVDQIWREAGSYYVLGYNAPVNDGRLHKIDVKVNAKGVTVRARRGRY